MDREGIKEIIPEREPILKLDFVDELVSMEMARGRKVVTEDECAGHYENRPICPLIYILESMNQLCNVLILSDEAYRDKLTLCAKMSKVKFYDTAKPGDVIEVTAHKKWAEDQLIACRVEASVDSKKIASAEIVMEVVEF